MAKATDSGRGKGKGGGGRSPQRSPMPPSGGQRVGARRFLREAWGEMRKVQWPTRQQVAQGTIVVGVVTIVIALFVAIVDVAAGSVVERLFELLD